MTEMSRNELHSLMLIVPNNLLITLTKPNHHSSSNVISTHSNHFFFLKLFLLLWLRTIDTNGLKSNLLFSSTNNTHQLHTHIHHKTIAKSVRFKDFFLVLGEARGGEMELQKPIKTSSSSCYSPDEDDLHKKADLVVELALVRNSNCS